MPSRNCSGFTPASTDTVESERLADEAVMNKRKNNNNMFYMGMYIKRSSAMNRLPYYQKDPGKSRIQFVS